MNGQTEIYPDPTPNSDRGETQAGIQNLSTSALLANATCDFDATGSTVTLTEKILQTNDLQVNMQPKSFFSLSSSHLATSKILPDFFMCMTSASFNPIIGVSIELHKSPVDSLMLHRIYLFL